MSKIKSNLSLIKKVILIVFLFLCNLSFYGNSLSQKSWSRDYFSATYGQNAGIIYVIMQFIDYEFGPNGEHAYFEWINIDVNLKSGKSVRLMRCEVNDQVRSDASWVYLKNKLYNAEIAIIGCYVPFSGYTWEENTNQMILTANYNHTGRLLIKWFITSVNSLKDITISGVWHVNGLNCNQEIIGERYSINIVASYLKSEITTDKKLKDLYVQEHLRETKTEHVFSEAGAVVITGAVGKMIQVFTTSGRLFYGTIATNDVVRIKLPENQIYIVHVRQTCYKVAL